MAKFEKGQRVSFVGDAAKGTKAKGTVMQFVDRVAQYEIHSDLGSVLHLPEEALTRESGGGRAKDKDDDE